MNMTGFKQACLSLALIGAGSLAWSQAQACTVAAWTGTNTTASTADVGGTAQSIRRYYGLCGLNAASSGKVVGENSPNNETTYRVRFYFYPALTAGQAKIFSATTGDNGTGTEVIGLTYDSSGQVGVLANGSQVGTLSGLTPNRWYAIELTYLGGTSIAASLRGNQTFTASTTITTNVPNSGIGSHTLGFISGTGASGTFQFDEFEASRSATTAIGFLNRGDAVPDGTYDLQDVIAVLREFRLGASGQAQGNADANEDGTVDLQDVIAVLRRFRNGSF